MYAHSDAIRPGQTAGLAKAAAPKPPTKTTRNGHFHQDGGASEVIAGLPRGRCTPVAVLLGLYEVVGAQIGHPETTSAPLTCHFDIDAEWQRFDLER